MNRFSSVVTIVKSMDGDKKIVLLVSCSHKILSLVVLTKITCPKKKRGETKTLIQHPSLVRQEGSPPNV